MNLKKLKKIYYNLENLFIQRQIQKKMIYPYKVQNFPLNQNNGKA